MKGAVVIMLGDFDLLASLYVAHFMVWRTIRTRDKERLARRKSLKLIRGGGLALGGNQALMPGGMGENGNVARSGREKRLQASRLPMLSNESGE